MPFSDEKMKHFLARGHPLPDLIPMVAPKPKNKTTSTPISVFAQCKSWSTSCLSTDLQLISSSGNLHKLRWLQKIGCWQKPIALQFCVVFT